MNPKLKHYLRVYIVSVTMVSSGIPGYYLVHANGGWLKGVNFCLLATQLLSGLLFWNVVDRWHILIGFVIATWRQVKSRRLLGVLAKFGWFCSKANRETMDCIIADLKKDEREMRKQGCGDSLIKCVIFWRAIVGGILPILWDTVIRLMSAIIPVAKIVGKIKGLW